MSQKDIDVSGRSYNKQVAIGPGSIEIKHIGKPVNNTVYGDGNVFLVIDCSGSMYGNKIEHAKKGALNFARDAQVKGYAIGLIQFHSEVKLLTEPTREIPAIQKYLDRMEVTGSTDMAKAICLAHQHLKDRSGNRAMVIITDGMPDSVAAALSQAEMVKKTGISIIAIGTDDADQDFLKKLASYQDLGMKVVRERFEEGITASVNLLGSGK